jgi:hypothetical protein
MTVDVSVTPGVIPLLGAPMAGASDQLLAQAVEAAAGRGLVGPDDHVVRSERTEQRPWHAAGAHGMALSISLQPCLSAHVA